MPVAKPAMPLASASAASGQSRHRLSEDWGVGYPLSPLNGFPITMTSHLNDIFGSPV